jgi:hypothetical protein
MRAQDTLGQFNLPTDNARLNDVVSLAYDFIVDYCGEVFKPKDFVMASLNAILASGKVAVSIQIPIGTKHAPDLLLEVDIRRKKVISRTCMTKMQQNINKGLRGI